MVIYNDASVFVITNHFIERTLVTPSLLEIPVLSFALIVEDKPIELSVILIDVHRSCS